MISSTRMLGAVLFASAIGLAALAPLAGPAGAKPSSKQSSAPSTAPSSLMEKLDGVWVEGRGYDVSYGGSYEACAQKCLGTEKCMMIEFYRPEKKCNLYDAMRPRKTGGSSNVGIRRTQVSGVSAK